MDGTDTKNTGCTNHMTYMHAVVGGTFDHLHAGHKALLSRACTVARSVTLGLTTDAYVAKYKETVDEENISGVACPRISTRAYQSYAVRKQHVTRWLRECGYLAKVRIVPIDDAYGPTLGRTDEVRSLDAIVVSSQTKQGAYAINKKRRALGLPELQIVEVSMVPAYDKKPISATRIRRGDITKEGSLVLPRFLRRELAQPFGEIIDEKNVASVMMRDRELTIITVGDKTTMCVLEHGVTPALAVIDLQVERQPFVWKKEEWDKLPSKRKEVQSGPGYISSAAITAISSWSQRQDPFVLVVDGEEDLLVLPIIVHAPLTSVVYYGQPQVGLVRVVVTRSVKDRAALLLKQFSKK